MSKRDPLQVAPQFRIRIIQLQKKMELKENKKISIRELTDMIANSKVIDNMEKMMLQKVKAGDIKLNFDRRKS